MPEVIQRALPYGGSPQLPGSEGLAELCFRWLNTGLLLLKPGPPRAIL